jgi:pyrophosphatase PpaX
VPKGAVLFDLDGTVIDTVVLIRESHRFAVQTVLGLDLPDERLVANVGRPLPEQMRSFSVERADELLAAYRKWNHDHTAELVREYPGMSDLLAALRGAGRPMAVVTSKARAVAQLSFDVLPVRDYFDVIVTTEDTPVHKPEPDPVLFALERLGTAPEDAVMVGDAPFDLRAGRAAGCVTVAVTWGFFDRETLIGEEPDVIVDSVDELTELLLEV